MPLEVLVRLGTSRYRESDSERRRNIFTSSPVFTTLKAQTSAFKDSVSKKQTLTSPALRESSVLHATNWGTPQIH